MATNGAIVLKNSASAEPTAMLRNMSSRQLPKELLCCKFQPYPAAIFHCGAVRSVDGEFFNTIGALAAINVAVTIRIVGKA